MKTLILGSLLAFLLLLSSCFLFRQSSDEKLEVVKGVTISFPDSWSLSAQQYTNAYELIMQPPKRDERFEWAQILITTERRTNHEDAIRRLQEIAAEVDTLTEFREIGGWPALERRYRAPLERIGQEVQEREMVLRSTTAIAADDLILRLETVVVSETETEVVEQAQSIGRSARFPRRAAPDEMEMELEILRKIEFGALEILPESQRAVGAKNDRKPALLSPGVPVNAHFGSEVAIAVSNDGENVVIGNNSGYAFSNDGGTTFTAVNGTPAPFPRDGDPSLAFGTSGAFYYGFIGFPNGSAAAGMVNGCSTGISVSTDNGATFTFRNHAVVCPNTGPGICFPDQEHIAADANNTATGGGDRVYSVWRNFTSGTATSCRIGSGSVTPSIVCSSDGAANWTAPAVVGTGDYPRIGVASDGFVYVVYRSGNNLMLNKYSSCDAGLTQQVGFPVTVTTVTDVNCSAPGSVPGLDRCNDGNILSSHMVAADDTNPNHIYVAYATNTAAGNEDIIVRDSNDGGITWTGVVRVNTSTTARRFMPWICTENGTAYVTWYDRRAATVGNNDLTDFYLGSAFRAADFLEAGLELNLSGNADPQCATGWPCSVRNSNNSEACSAQPQLAGRCRNPAGGGSNTLCDFTTGPCPFGETCQQFGGGCPKYGDYNGVACAQNRIYTAWASATAPPTLPAVTNIRTFSEVVEISDLLPELVITTFEMTGSATVNSEGDVEVPIRVIIENQGGEAADVFKVSMDFTIPPSTFDFNAPFIVPGEDVYPFTDTPLPPGDNVRFEGKVVFLSSRRGQTVSLVGVADSCSGDEFMPDHCRIREIDEDNNRSSMLISLPR